jgi:hypothetical protein
MGVADAKIDDFAQRWLQAASAAELEEVVDEFEALEELIRSDPEQTTEKFAEVMQCMTEFRRS